MTFLQMLLNKGRMNGVEILRSETVSSMMTNHIGDLQVVEMKAVYPTMSKDFDLFPGKSHKWGLSFDINEHDVPGGRRAGSIAWAGALNTHYWVDPVAKVTGALFTQVWPFCDEKVVALFAEFEQALYKATGRN